MINDKNTTVVGRETVYRGFVRVDRYRLQHSLYGGGSSDTIEREIMRRGDVAAVIPVDPVRDRVVLIEQFRPGAMAANWDSWLIECVAGMIEPGEDAAEVARRESLEEAGCELLDLLPVARFLLTPGVSSETVQLYCGRVDSDTVGGLHGLSHEGEDIRATTVPIPEALGLLEEGKIVNAITLIALQWLALHYAEVKKRWA